MAPVGGICLPPMSVEVVQQVEFLSGLAGTRAIPTILTFHFLGVDPTMAPRMDEASGTNIIPCPILTLIMIKYKHDLLISF